MARAKITALRPNETFLSPDGPVKATPERLRAIADTFQKMKAARLNVPVPFGHQLKALPESYDEEQFLKSRYNAGYLADVEINQSTGSLDVVIDTPCLQHDKDSGCLIDPSNKTAIKEVSLALAREFRDGKGRAWNDAIIHAALVTHPVVDGQDQGFVRMSLNASPQISGLMFLSLGSPSTWRLALDDKDKDMSDDDPAEPAPEPTPEPTPTPAVQQQFDQELLQLLADHGIVLPADVTDDNFCDYLKVALTALKGRLEPFDSGGPPSVPTGATEGTSTQMLALLTNSTLGQKLVADFRGKQQQEAKAKLDELRARGLRPELAQELEAEVTAIATTRLSLTAAGDIDTPAVFSRLSLLDRGLPIGNKLTQRLALAKEMPSPAHPEDKSKTPAVIEQTEKLKKFAGAAHHTGAGKNGTGK